MAGKKRPAVFMFTTISALGASLCQSFVVVPRSIAGTAYHLKERRLASHGRIAASTSQRVVAGGGMMMGITKKQKGSGLTNVARVVATLERVKYFDEPQKVMMGNLDYSIDEQGIRDICRSVGTVTQVKLIRQPDGTSKGYAFVDFETPLWATAAIEELHGTMTAGRRISVRPAFRKEEREKNDTHNEWLRRQGKVPNKDRFTEDELSESATVDMEANEQEQAIAWEAGDGVEDGISADTDTECNDVEAEKVPVVDGEKVANSLNNDTAAVDDSEYNGVEAEKVRELGSSKEDDGSDIDRYVTDGVVNDQGT